MFQQKTWYRIAGAILAAGAITSLAIQEWVSLAVFAPLSALMFFIAQRIDRWIDNRYGNNR